MAGLIDAAVNQNDPLSGMKGYEADQIDIDPSTDTVEGRVEGIIAKNSAPMQLNKTRALQEMNERGLVNTSMAVGAGQNALYDWAVPIATEDAKNSIDVKGANMNATNEGYGFTAAAGNEGSLLQRAGQQDIENIEAQHDASRDLAEQQQFFNRENIQTLHGNQMEINQQTHDLGVAMQNILGKQAIDLTNLKGQWDNIMQTNQSNAIIWSTAMQAIGQILSNPDIPLENKQGLVDQQLGSIQDWMAVTGTITNLDLGGILGTNPAPGTTDGTTTDGTTTGDLIRPEGMGNIPWNRLNQAGADQETIDRVFAFMQANPDANWKQAFGAVGVPGYGDVAAKPDGMSWEDFQKLTQIYQEELGRPPQQEGIDGYWKIMQEQGKSPEDLREGISASEEGTAWDVSQGTHPSGLSGPQYNRLTSLYKEELGREIDPGGLEYYAGLIKNGTGWDEIRLRLDESMEGENYDRNIGVGDQSYSNNNNNNTANTGGNNTANTGGFFDSLAANKQQHVNEGGSNAEWKKKLDDWVSMVHAAVNAQG
jgi:hypothetical protein